VAVSGKASLLDLRCFPVHHHVLGIAALTCSWYETIIGYWSQTHFQGSPDLKDLSSSGY